MALQIDTVTSFGGTSGFMPDLYKWMMPSDVERIYIMLISFLNEVELVVYNGRSLVLEPE